MRRLTVSSNKTENFAGCIYICLQMFILPYLLAFFNGILPAPLSSVELNFVYFALNFICVTVIFHHYLLSSIKHFLRKPYSVLQYAFLGFLIYQLGRFVITYVILLLYPGFSNLNDQTVVDSVTQNYTLMSIGIILLAPVTEEVLYRGVVFGGIYRTKPILAYVVSSSIFSLIHIVGYIGQYKPVELLCSFVLYLPAGLCFAWSYERSGNIIAPILIHIANNQLGILYLR